MNFTNLFSINLLAKTIIIGEVPVYWRRGGSATFDLLLQNSSITKQKSIGSFIVTLMNSPITKRCFVILSKAKNLLFRDIFEIPIAMITRNRRSPPAGPKGNDNATNSKKGCSHTTILRTFS